ncbi:glycerophosphoryl diester phosphodiesterase membrane domain-containing protein [Erysipelothrix aquatica]|uniref:glycerophosphoryl diester phosphodiesterase membrane domain-containing protein n=1 Tax=Erysipelothrix aquatica TaxID=2683714 RepID=UPI001356F2B9|nr:glycerophosphoryl diester phosphodiesterase membrane domain-containing protein [Erysipelothrix aquatica]
MKQKIKVRDIFKSTFKYIRFDMWRYLVVAILAETMVILLTKQITNRLFDLALVSAKVHGINNENFLGILFNPIAIILLLVMVVVLGSIGVVQLIAILAFADRKYHPESLTVKSIFAPLKRLRVKDIPIFLIYIFIIMPFGNIGLTSTVTSSLQIPLFLIDFIYEFAWMKYAYITLGWILFYLNLRLFYAIIIFYNEDVNFYEALKRSWKMTRRQEFTILKIVAAIGFLSVLSILVGSMVLLVAGSFIETVLPQYQFIIETITNTLVIFWTFTTIAFASVWLIQTVTVSYHELKGTQIHIHTLTPKSRRRLQIINVGVIFVYLGFSALLYLDMPNNELRNDTQIVAHRGDTKRAVENSLESLQYASEFKPDYVEMDVQEISDGTIVVFHDPDLKRVGTNSNAIYPYTWEDLSKEKLISKGHESTIPTFKEYMELARSLNQKIMVEIKAHKTDSPEYLANIMQIIRDADMEHMVSFQSLDKKAIVTFKEMFPNAYTGYIIGFNLGGIEPMPVDFYSIEDTSITTRAVNDIKNQKKALYAWTINTSDLMEVYIRTNVNGIITDDPETANQVKQDIKNGPLDRLFWSLESIVDGIN